MSPSGPSHQDQDSYDVGVIGGCGHVGLPLALLIAKLQQRVLVYDVNAEAVARVGAGQMPFAEDGAPELLAEAVASGRLRCTADPAGLARCALLVLIIGTPVDEHLNPTLESIPRALERCLPWLRDDQVLILRSTVYPGTSARVQEWLRERGKATSVAFCPERVAQGKSLREMAELPQIVSAFDERGLRAAEALFGRMTDTLVTMEPMEAEIAKLFTNAWRYIQFATVNQFYMMAESHGLDFQRILDGIRFKYPRLAGMPGPGLAAGPCLFKDTMQLAAFSQNQFFLGHAAMLVNEGLPAFLISELKKRTPLAGKTVGVLGMAFKAGSDDARSSLSYKLKKILQLEARRVLCTDPYVADATLVPLETVLRDSDALVVGTPHEAYRAIQVRPGVEVVDVWGVLPEERA
ncbi:MAG TPA: nucleotide sugar dehydrogenase [Myxococcaceae bacterium]|jgi:UDP-N-acetyl-D-mannosaminuronic acid dehydrogenase